MRRRDVLRAAAGAAALPLTVPPVTARQQSYGPLSSVRIRGAKEAVVDSDGETVYVATTDGFAVVDLRDPASPEILSQASFLLSTHEDGPLPEVHDVKVDGDTLVAVGPANAGAPTSNRLQGMVVYDVSDPAAPERTAFYETDYPIHNAFLKDGIAYLTANNFQLSPVVLVDVTGGKPTELARWSIIDHDEDWLGVHWYLRTNHDLYVHDDTLYVAHWDAGTWLVDVTDPQNPEYINHFGHYEPADLADIENPGVVGTELRGNSHYVAVNDDATLLAVGREAWDDTTTERIGGPGGIEIWDVNDPQNPRELSFIDPPPTPNPARQGTWTTAHNFDFHGDRLYTSWYRGGVKIHDVSDPANPEQLAWWRRPDRTEFWTAQYLNGDAFVASSVQGGEEYPPGLYTFPNRAGEQADPPALVPTNDTTTPGTTSTTTTTSTTATTNDGESGRPVPGFGALAGLAAVSAGALAAWRRHRN